MSKKNIFISHRWDYEDDYNRINALIDRTKYDVSNRSVESCNPLPGSRREVTAAIKGKISSASIILVPARPAAVTAGSMGREELDYAISIYKKIIAVDTGSSFKIASFWAENNIPVIACRKDSLEKEIG